MTFYSTIHFRYRLGAIQKMMADIDGSVDQEHLNHKNDLKKDILRRKGQLSQVYIMGATES